MKKIQTSLVLGLLLTLAGGVTPSAQAADDTKPDPQFPNPQQDPPKKPEQPPAPPTKTKAAAKTTKGEVSGKIVAVDPVTKTITLQNKEGTYTVKVEDSTTLTAKDGTPVRLSDLKPGEDLTANVLFTQLPNGQIEVALVSAVRQQQATAQAQGGGSSGGTAKSSPFGNTPANTSNIDGKPRVSEHQ